VSRALRLLGLGLATGVLLAATGCAYVGPRVDVGDTRPSPPPPEAAPPAVASGAIFQPVRYRPLFEDHRARLAATATSTSSVEKSGSLSASIVALPGIPASALRRGVGEAATGNTAEGSGSTENRNDFSGTITVIVREVLPNGHLLVAGEKQLGVNQNIDVLRFSGQVDPRAIQPGNSVPSASIANVRLEQRGRGAAAEAQAMGWLQRVFLNFLPI
jgi:flagellar L-ring protein FlgH